MNVPRFPALKKCQRVHFHFLEGAIEVIILYIVRQKIVYIVSNEKKRNRGREVEVKTYL